MWFQLALYPDASLLGVLVGFDNRLYFRIMDLGYLLGRKYGFAKRYPYDNVFGKGVLPLIQKYPRYTANARLVTQDTAYSILCRENREQLDKHYLSFSITISGVMVPLSPKQFFK
ncbi:hypothetical protein TNCV_4437591 [Trichonephila clavipes]|nr:hypothetical protein TNCV_4437591 [Trichonephila clavipes]